MKHIFIINAAAGQGGSAQRILRQAEALQKRHNLNIECLFTRYSGHAAALAEEIAAAGAPVRFYACGGDGTAGEVANGIAGRDNAAMTVIPIGTGNDLVKNFGEDAGRFLDPEALWNSEAQTLDLIDCNGRLCLTIACSGIDARIARDVHQYSSFPLLRGKSGYIASLLVNFLFKGIGSRWTVTLGGGKPVTQAYSLIAVCNGRYYGGGFMPVAEASMTDGVLDVLVVKAVSRARFARFVGPYSKGNYRQFSRFASCCQTDSVRITSEQKDIVTCLDGECFVSDDVSFRLSGKKLRFFGPAGSSPDATRRVERKM